MQGVRKVLFECPLIPKEIYRYYSPKRKLFMKKVRRSIRSFEIGSFCVKHEEKKDYLPL